MKNLQKKRGLRATVISLFTCFLIITLLTYHLYQLTTYETVEDVGVGVSRDIIDMQSIIEFAYPELIKMADMSPDSDLVIPGLGIDLGIKAGEIRDIPKDRIGDYISRLIIKQIYYEGLSTVYKQSALEGTDQDSLNSIVHLVDTFASRRFNDTVLLIFYAVGLCTILLAIPLFLLSPGFYKLTGFGGSFIVAGVPGLFASLTRVRIESAIQDSGVVPGLVLNTLLPIIERLQFSYLAILFLGVGLFLIGMSGIFITRRKVKSECKSVQP